MAIDKALLGSGTPMQEGGSVEIEIVNPEAMSINTPDGGMVIDFDPETEDLIEHGSNLAEYIEDNDLDSARS